MDKQEGYGLKNGVTTTGRRKVEWKRMRGDLQEGSAEAGI